MSNKRNEWMHAREAISRAAAIVAGDRGRATLSIRYMARVGLIHSRARSLTRPGCEPVTNADLPPSFWSPPKGLLATAAWVPLEDWEQGVFEGNGTALGAWRAGDVEFLRRDIDRHYPERFPKNAADASQPKRGRSPGVGSYAKRDGPLWDEMRRLRETGVALSDYKAAEEVVDRADGGGTRESKTKRLVRGYKRKFS